MVKMAPLVPKWPKRSPRRSQEGSNISHWGSSWHGGAGRKGVRGPGGRSRGGRVHVSLGPAQYLISQGPSSTSGGAKSPQATPRWPKRLQEAPSEASRQAPIANFPSPPNSSNPFSLPSFPYSFLLFPSTCTYACCRVFVVIAITVVSIISPTTTLQCGERV